MYKKEDASTVIERLRDYEELDIRFNRPSPLCELSNLWPREFVFKGVKCGSIEGVFASLFAPTHMRDELVMQAGFDAFYDISKQKVRNFMYFDKPIDRYGEEYQEFLEELYYSAFSQCEFSREILLATYKMGIVLRHSVGKSGKDNTILTESEFVTVLNKVRLRLHVDEYERKGLFDFG